MSKLSVQCNRRGVLILKGAVRETIESVTNPIPARSARHVMDMIPHPFQGIKSSNF
jgi:hypothetical protein